MNRRMTFEKMVVPLIFLSISIVICDNFAMEVKTVEVGSLPRLDQSKARAHLFLGKIDLKGDAGQKNYEKAVGHFTSSAKLAFGGLSQAWASLHLGIMVFYEQGVRRDFEVMDSHFRDAMNTAQSLGSFGKDVLAVCDIFKELAKKESRPRTIGDVISALHLAVERGNKTAVEFMIMAAEGEGAEALIRKKEFLEMKVIDGKRALHLAAEKGFKDVVELLIANGAEINAIDDDGATALHQAANNFCKDVVELLLKDGAQTEIKDSNEETPLSSILYTFDSLWVDKERIEEIKRLLIAYGADINAKGRGGITALHALSCSGKRKKVEDLLNLGANPEICDDSGKTALFGAVLTDNKNIVELLLARKVNVNVRDNRGRSALHFAITRNKIIAKLLINGGSQIEVADDSGDTPLSICITQNQHEIAEMLIARGANILREEPFWGSALHMAAALGKKEMVKLLLDHGADRTLRNKSGALPIDVAKTEEIKLLLRLKESKKDESNTVNPTAVLPKREAQEGSIQRINDACNQQIEGFEKTQLNIGVLEAGERVAIATQVIRDQALESQVVKWHPLSQVSLEDGKVTAEGIKRIASVLTTSAAAAFEEPRVSILDEPKLELHEKPTQEPIAVNSSVNVMDVTGTASLHRAAMHGSKRDVELLLASGANIEAFDSYYCCPALLLAAEHGHREVVELLLARDADIDAKDQYERTALHRAAMHDRKEIVEVLLSHGADTKAIDKNGETAVDLAKKDEIRALLSNWQRK